MRSGHTELLESSHGAVWRSTAVKTPGAQPSWLRGRRASCPPPDRLAAASLPDHGSQARRPRAPQAGSLCPAACEVAIPFLYRGGPPNRTVASLEQLEVPASHTL